MSRGMFIVLEGCDKSGKSTQSKLLADYLLKRNQNTIMKQYPNRTTATGKLIDSYLKKTFKLNFQAAHLLFSANRWEEKQLLEHTLLSGTHVVCDRYTTSGVVFSCANGISVEWAMQSDKGLVQPDLIVYLDSTRNAALMAGEEIYETNEFQEKVKQKFKEIGKGMEAWRVVDANQSIQVVHENIVNLIKATQINERLAYIE